MFALRTFAMPRVLGTLAFTLTALMLIGAGTARGACPNEALRQKQSATFLPDCRAYEMASPPAKNGGAVSEIRWQAAPSGDAVAFVSKSSFPDASAAPLAGNYLSRRGADNWATDQIDLPQLNSLGFIQGVTLANSEDLRYSLQISRRALAPGAIEEGSNIYLVDNFGGGVTLVVARPGEDLFREMAMEPTNVFAGASSDWSHVAFLSRQALLPGAIAEVANLYEFTEGELRLVSLLPNGESWPLGVSIGEEGSFVARPHVVSADGSRIFFNAIPDSGGSGGLFMRENGTTTVAISKSQKTGAPEDPVATRLPTANADGSVVYFLSESDLTDASETKGKPSLYRYDVESEELTDLTVAGSNPEGAYVTAVLGISEDGSYVYFAALGALAPGASEVPPDPNAVANIYVWHAGEIRYIGQTSPKNEEFNGPVAEPYASPNGLYFGIGTRSPLNGEDVPSPACPGGEGGGAELCADVYLYDYAADQLTCVSCAGPAAGNSSLGGALNEDRPGASARRVLDDGTLFFNTPNPLVARDGNGQVDAYRWRQGTRSLLSTGAGAGPSTFGDATPDGSSVFIRTSQPLVSQDVDANYDLYAVRVNGGLETQNAPPPPAPCLGEGCRGAAAGGSNQADPATLSVQGAASGGSKCGRLAAKARKARARARTLRARARDGGGRARWQQARRATRTAKKLTTKATNCGGQS